MILKEDKRGEAHSRIPGQGDRGMGFSFVKGSCVRDGFGEALHTEN